MQAIDEALKTLFTTDATLMALVGGIHNSVAPKGSLPPMVIFQQVGPGVDEYALAGRIRTVYHYQIRVCGEGRDVEPSNDAASRIDVLLMDGALTADTIYCRREGELPYMPEMDAGVIYQQVGATYRIEVHG